MLAEAVRTSSAPRGRTHRIRNWTRLKAKDLWDNWREQFECDDDAIVTAIWMANRLVKDRALTSRRTFYSIKDEAIRRYAVAGKRAREEKAICWDCGGTGESPYWEEEVCEKCGGSGVYRSRWLYLHEFTVAGVPYKLHSYQEPKVLAEEAAGDAEHFGNSFTPEEYQRLALPFSGLLKILRFVAVTRWGMQIDNGHYR